MPMSPFTSSTTRESNSSVCCCLYIFAIHIFATNLFTCIFLLQMLRRIWGSNTHVDLPSAATALRKTVKNRIVASALRIKEGSTFHRGRQLGALEANITHELREKKNSTKRALEDARKSLKRDSAKAEDWSQLSPKELLRELIKRKVIMKTANNDNEIANDEANLEYSKAFVSLCNKFLSMEANATYMKFDGSHTEQSGHSTTSPNEK